MIYFVLGSLYLVFAMVKGRLVIVIGTFDEDHICIYAAEGDLKIVYFVFGSVNLVFESLYLVFGKVYLVFGSVHLVFEMVKAWLVFVIKTFDNDHLQEEGGLKTFLYTKPNSKVEEEAKSHGDILQVVNCYSIRISNSHCRVTLYFIIISG